MEEENIITVRNRNLQKADEAFADFMGTVANIRGLFL